MEESGGREESFSGETQGILESWEKAVHSAMLISYSRVHF